jgi:hypothetical protein
MFCLETEHMRANTILSWVALCALGSVRESVRASSWGCGSGSSLTVSRSPVSPTLCSVCMRHRHKKKREAGLLQLMTAHTTLLYILEDE